MALTTPFINPIPAFSATDTSTHIEFYVKGGDAITGYSFAVYRNDGSSTPLFSSQVTPVSNDIASETIRDFYITIDNTMGLQNNNSYRLQITTYGADNESIQSNFALFQCYKNPIVTLQYATIVGGQSVFLNLADEVVVSQNITTIKILFNPNDFQSIAEPNTAKISLYGINDDGSTDFITSIDNIYNFEHNISTDIYSKEIELSGFTLTQNEQGELLPIQERKHKAFRVEYELYTLERWKDSGAFTNIGCYYSAVLTSPFVTINNLCQEGVIEINCTVTSYQGTSNIPINSLVYIDDEELDLRPQTYPGFTEAYAQWQNYFTLKQPYTLRVWGRAFNEGTILRMTSSSVRAAYYVDIKYNKETVNNVEYVYLSLESGQKDYQGADMFPYYIESERIASSNITDSTKLFIGIQEQDGLFDLDFEIIT